MSVLRAYVGSRDTAMESPAMADQPRAQPTLNDDRVQAKLHEMGFSDVQDQFDDTGQALHGSQSKRQTAGDQHRIALTRAKLPRNLAISSITNNRWHGYKSTPLSPPSAKDEIESEQGLLSDPANHRDLFDTDTENLDSTITLSDLDDPQAFQACPLPDKAATSGLDQIYESGYLRGESLSSVGEHRQRQCDGPSKAPEKNDLTMNKEEYATGSGLDEINNENAPDQEVQIGDELSSHGLAEELNSAEYIYHSKEPTKIQPADAGPFKTSPTVYKKSVMRNSGERSPDSANQFSKLPWLDPGHTIDARLRITGAPCSFPKKGSSRPEDFRLSSSARTPKPMESDPSKEGPISGSSRQDYQHKTAVIRDSQSLVRQPSESHRMTSRTLVTSEPPVSIMARAYSFPNIPNVANRQVFHDADDATSDTHSRKRDIDLDYNPIQLREMVYERLRHESFDQIKPVQGAADQALSEKLQNLYDLKGSIDPHLKRTAFFSNLMIEQFEECGDLMIERFSDMVKQYRVARQQKRMVARAFEEEIARREERIRTKLRVVEQDLGRLRKAGEDVVRGKGV
ncbi:hypothetical protein MMC29_000750 [Sticta canariensis]|nr:hypothetical protein [Sticta canariensis]